MNSRKLAAISLSSLAVGLAVSQRRLRFATAQSSSTASHETSSTSSNVTRGAPKNPSDCKETACKSKVDTLKASFGKAGLAHPEGQKVTDEPPTREVLGRAGWTVLHCFAAYYPDSPTEDEKRMALNFLEAFSNLYPCKDCAEGLRISMEDSPPRINSRADFSLWVCETHNRVNEQLGKSTTPCDLATLDKRWRGK